LGLLYACSESPERTQVDERAAKWGCDLSRNLTSQLVCLGGRWVAENPYVSKRKRVLRLISDAGECGISRSELYAKTRSLPTRERAEILEALLLCGDIREETDRPGRSGGPTRLRYIALRPKPSENPESLV
jgi:hypothetical protein